MNSWDPDEKLQRINFNLEGAAKTWFENLESMLRSWDIFRTMFLSMFASVVCKERVGTILETRMQLLNESVTIFIEEMTWLFRHADPTMAKEEKLQFLMRVVKEELFLELVHNPPKTVEENLIEATTIEKALEMRTKQYNRHSSTQLF